MKLSKCDIRKLRKYQNRVFKRRYRLEYKKLLVEAYDALSQNDDFAKSLLKTDRSILIHSIVRGKGKNETVLTENEFVSQLLAPQVLSKYKVYDSIAACGNGVEILNYKYRAACKNNINFQKHPEGRGFKRAFYRAIDAVALEKIT